MLSVASIRARIVAVLDNQLSLDDFEDWLVSSSWNALQHADDEVRQLVAAIELRLAEYSVDHLDEAELRAELLTLLLHGCSQQPMQSTFISFSDPVTVMTTVEDGPDYHFRIERSQTSPTTTTGSARTVVRQSVALAS